MSELTFDEFLQQPMQYMFGSSGDVEALRIYRNDASGVQKETVTKRKRRGDIYAGWHPSETYYLLDGDTRTFHSAAELYVTWMERVCGMPQGSGGFEGDE